jgi:archaeosine synthase beta-subunit
VTSAVGPIAAGYPEGSNDRDRFVLDRRPPRRRHDPWRYQGLLVEDEPTAAGALATVATVFLTGRECPWRCVMCDLWRYTTEDDTPAGAIPAQLDQLRAELDARPEEARPSVVKLYNAGSFFDPRAVPVSDYDAIAARLAEFDHVVVESHPALVGPRLDQLREALGRRTGPEGRSVGLEVAMGLETAHQSLARLHKRMTLEDFRLAAEYLKARAVALRVFVLVHPPFIPRAEREESLASSVEFAFACGASAVSLIPTRSGNGAMEALAEQGLFEASTLRDFERAVEIARSRSRGRVLADLWNLDRLAICPRCFFDRAERLRLQNLQQRDLPPVPCESCEGSPLWNSKPT